MTTPLVQRIAPRDLVIAGSVIAWVGALFIAFHPGLMSYDSIRQYAEGLSGEYGNWFPPFVALAYGLAGRLVGSPWPILLGQLLVLGGAMASLVRRIPAQRAVAFPALLAAYLLAPPIWSVGVTLWKDVMMTAAMLAAVSALRRGRHERALAWLLLSVLARHNAIFAAVPLVIYAVGCMAANATRLVRWSATVAAIVALGAAPKVVEKVLHARDEWTVGALLAFDEVAIYASHPELLRSSPFAGQLTPEDLPLIYMPASCQPIFSGAPGPHRLTGEGLAARRDAIGTEWVRLVRMYPATYTKHRLLHFKSLLSLDGGPVCYPFWIGIDGNPWHLHLREHTLLYRGLRKFQDAASQSILFRGWFWVLALAILAALSAVRYRRAPLAFWTALSGLAYASAYVVIGVTCEFRYLYWSVVAAFGALAVFLGQATEASGYGGERSGLRANT